MISTNYCFRATAEGHEQTALFVKYAKDYVSV